MPENTDIPKAFKRIADDMDAGKPVKDYKPEVLDAIYKYVRTGEGGDDPVLRKLKGMLTAPAPEKSAEAVSKYGEYDDGAKMAYFRQKLIGKLAEKNPKAWEKIAPAWAEMSKDPVTHTAQVRQRASFEADQGKTKITNDELKSLLGKDFNEFQRIRKERSNFNNGISENSDATMKDGFGFDDLAPTIRASWDDNDKYYRPSYDGNELSVDTNIPGLTKKKKAQPMSVETSLAKQQP